ncbi:MAG: cytochrome c oxidase assembly protein [Cellulomonas sp.]
MLPPLTLASFLTSWVLDPLGVGFAVVLVGTYVVLVHRVRRDGGRWSRWRGAAFLGLGVGSLVLATCGGFAVYRSALFSVGAAQAALLSAVTPVGIALGEPVGLAERALGPAAVARLNRSLRGPLARVLMFPMVSSVLAVGSLIAVFYSTMFTTSMSSTLVRDGVYALLLVTGVLVVLPLLGEELLPRWCTPPVRALFAFADGLLDAIPGVLVMTASAPLAAGVLGFASRTWGATPAWDQKIGGGTMLAIAEVVGLPVLGAIIADWVRSDEADARAVDAVLDARAAESGEAGESGRMAPWWESDPRYVDRER